MQIAGDILLYLARWLVDAEVTLTKYISLKVNELLQRDDCLACITSPGNLVRAMYILPKEHPFAGNVYMNGNAALRMTGNMNGLKLIFSKAQVASFFAPNRTQYLLFFGSHTLSFFRPLVVPSA